MKVATPTKLSIVTMGFISILAFVLAYFICFFLTTTFDKCNVNPGWGCGTNAWFYIPFVYGAILGLLLRSLKVKRTWPMAILTAAVAALPLIFISLIAVIGYYEYMLLVLAVFFLAPSIIERQLNRG